MGTIAFIPARGGSKGIPGKNIKKIAGKPLIAWSIEQALDAQLIEKVVVSTDSAAIAKVASEYGAEVPFLRPEEYSGDTATTESAMLHFCAWAETAGWQLDSILLIQCTSPVRADGRFDDAIRFFEEGGYDSLIAVAPTHRFFWKNPESPEATYDFRNRPRRQDIPRADRLLMETGSFYITRIDSFLQSKNRITGSIGLYATPEDEAYEIDSLTDFGVCESILKGQLGNN